MFPEAGLATLKALTGARVLRARIPIVVHLDADGPTWAPDDAGSWTVFEMEVDKPLPPSGTRTIVIDFEANGYTPSIHSTSEQLQRAAQRGGVGRREYRANDLAESKEWSWLLGARIACAHLIVFEDDPECVTGVAFEFDRSRYLYCIPGVDADTVVVPHLVQKLLPARVRLRAV